MMSRTQKPQAIGLRRISSDDQLSGHSLEAQEESIRKTAKELDVELVEIIGGVRSAKAGKNDKREDLKRVLELCRKNRRIKYLLIDRVSRLMREMMLMIHYIVELENLGVEVYFCSETQRSLNDKGGMSQFMLVMEAFKAEQENRERTETVVTRMKARYAAGYYLSHPHAGYERSNEPGIHIPNSMFPLLQKACHLIIYEGYTSSQAVRWLNDNGYRTRAGRKLDLNHFEEFIVDEYYCGVINIQSEGWPKGVKGLHQPMLTKEEHKKLCYAISKRNPRVRRKHNPEFPLSNLLLHYECAESDCPKTTGYQHNRGKRPSGSQRPIKPVYGCRNCGKRIKRDVVHENLSSLLDSLEIKDRERLIATLQKVWKMHTGNREENLRGLKKRITDIEVEKNKTVRDFVSTDNPALKKALEERVNELDNNINELQESIVGIIDAQDQDMDEFIEFAIDKAENLRGSWWSLSFEDKTRCERILFPGHFYADTSAKLHTPKISDIYTLKTNKKDLSKLDKSLMVELAGTAPASAGLS